MGTRPKQPRKSGESCVDYVISWKFEEEAALKGARYIAGIDEAGRGPLAGPVVAAAVILPFSMSISGINDSKLLRPRQRERLFVLIKQMAIGVGVGIVSPEMIDKINVYQATRLAMKIAVTELMPPPDFLLIDGPMVIDLNIRQQKILKGDRLSVSIAAAGIIAKVTRDGIMDELHERYPLYGFNRHKGYPTQSHKQAICLHGPSPAHRKCFRGVKEHILPPLIHR